MDFDVDLFKEFYEAYMSGMSYAEIGRKFNCKKERVRKIVIRYGEELEDLKDPMYATIIEYAPYHEMGVKLYRALKNAGYHSIEELSQLSDKKIREIKNVGNVMTDIIIRICNDKKITRESDSPYELKRKELKELCYKYSKTAPVGSRLFNNLEACGIHTVDDIRMGNPFELIDQYGIGKRTVEILINIQVAG